MIRYYCDPADPSQEARVENQFIGEETYKEMVEKTPIPCTDAVLVVQGDKALYLAKRSVYPMKGVWVLGGRIWFNDVTLHDSIARCVKLETGVEFGPDRFIQLSAPHMYSWLKTKQGNFPGKNLVITFKLEVSNRELECIASGIKKSEYDREFGIQRYSRERLVNEKVHPMLIDIYDDIFGS